MSREKTGELLPGPVPDERKIASFRAEFELNSAPTGSRVTGTTTIKEQCKEGGDVAFGFENRGACVSFVASGGKNEPGKNQKK
jgi:hypothetical protein